MTREDLSKSEIERLARLRTARLRILRITVIWVVIVGAIAAGAYFLIDYSKKAAANKPGEPIPDLGQEHIPVGSPRPEYNSNPPTSGPHYEQPANWGIYDDALPDEQLVHNLEHGGIWISYKSKDDQEMIGKLKDITDDYKVKLILTYRPENDASIAVAAWTRLLKLQTFDEKQIKSFIRAFINKGPEQVPY